MLQWGLGIAAVVTGKRRKDAAQEHGDDERSEHGSAVCYGTLRAPVDPTAKDLLGSATLKSRGRPLHD